MRKKVGKTAEKAVVGYTRVSTNGQAEHGASLAEQEARIRRWAELAGLPVAAIHTDTMSGGRASNRPGLQAALAEVCRRRGVLVVVSLSRLARSTRDMLSLAEKLEACGAEFASASEKIDTTTASGKLMFRMLSVLAEFERDLVSERTTATAAHLRRLGRRISRHVPFGYVASADGRHLSPQPEEQAVIATMQQLRGQGFTLRAIAAELARRGVRTKSGRPTWAPNVIADVLARAERMAA